MLLVLGYHRVGKGKLTSSLRMLEEHLAVWKNYPVVLPGEPVEKGRLSICLTFDDAYCDIYYLIFPLLQRLGLRAVVGVPTAYIVEETTLPIERRLSISYNIAMQNETFRSDVPFCTWQELQDMVNSGTIHVASHSHQHPLMTFPFVDLHKELVHSKELLEQRLLQSVSSFIYPFGRWNMHVQREVMKHYLYAFRGGARLNICSWNHTHRPLGRVFADGRSITKILSLKNRCLYACKGIQEYCVSAITSLY